MIFFYLLYYCVTSVQYTILLQIQQLWIVSPDFWLWIFFYYLKKDFFPIW